VHGRTTSVVPRIGTNFFRLQTFDNAINSFGTTNAAQIAAHIARFESTWCSSRNDGDLPPRYGFEHYKNVHDPYRLCHIRVGANNNYRAVVLFPNGLLEAYWVYAFKKGTKQNQEMNHARNCAKAYWETRKENK
jgi:hypothetical protein